MNPVATDIGRDESTSSCARLSDGDSQTGATEASALATGSEATGLKRWLGRRLLSAAGDPPIELVFWDGATATTGRGQPQYRVVMRDLRTMLKLVSNPRFHFSEAYSDGTLEIEGDLGELLTTVFRSIARADTDNRPVSWLARSLRCLTGNTLAGARRNIHHHYDIGNDFYKLWLDWQMVYTCAYFAESGHSLEQAQIAKMDHVCRKVRLAPGETVVEAGCGWGAFALHMAKHYGVRVRAFNISQEQIRYARQWARRESLEDRVEFLQDDWRNIRGQYDVFISIGMLEHVGLGNFRRLGQLIDRCLKPTGRGMLHSIGRNRPAPVNGWISRRIFPGAYAPTLEEITRVLQPYNFSVLDVENLRLHYAETLRHWLDRYERSVDEVRRMFDERFVRMWRTYLVGSMVAFQTGGLQLFQVLFNRGHSNAVPRTRHHLYANEGTHVGSGWAPEPS